MRDCTIHVEKTKTLISCAVFTAQLIGVFVFAYAKIRFSHNEAHFTVYIFPFWRVTFPVEPLIECAFHNVLCFLAHVVVWMTEMLEINV